MSLAGWKAVNGCKCVWLCRSCRVQGPSCWLKKRRGPWSLRDTRSPTNSLSPRVKRRHWRESGGRLKIRYTQLSDWAWIEKFWIQLIFFCFPSRSQLRRVGGRRRSMWNVWRRSKSRKKCVPPFLRSFSTPVGLGPYPCVFLWDLTFFFRHCSPWTAAVKENTQNEDLKLI